MRVKQHLFSINMIIFLLTSSLFSIPVIASNKDYLAAIDADVAEFSTGVFTPPEGSAWIGSSIAKNAAEISSLDSQEAFSSYLQSKSPGTYIFYRKLPNQSKQQVYEEYLATGDVERMKKSVFRYLSDSRKSNKR